METQVRYAGAPVERGRAALPVWAALAILAAAAWAVTVARARDMGVAPGTMGMSFAVFVAMWVAMMAAMMFPALGPVAAGEAAVAAGVRRVAGGVVFGLAFLLPWALYGAAAFGVVAATARLVDHAPDVARWVGVAIIGTAAVYQFTPWKLRALEHCRMTMRHDRSGSDAGAGVRDGAICVGCCWAMMAILVAVGVMNVVAMVGLAVVIFAEKLLPRPRLIAAMAGVAFLALAVAAAVHPSLLGGLHVSRMAMPAMPMTGGM